MNKNKLKIARKKIDKIDNKIFILIKQRTQVVKSMLKIKKLKKQIVDQKRIFNILKNIKKKSIKNKIDYRITTRIWKSMIWAYVRFQRTNFKKK